jgi:hypothetical protein
MDRKGNSTVSLSNVYLSVPEERIKEPRRISFFPSSLDAPEASASDSTVSVVDEVDDWDESCR